MNLSASKLELAQRCEGAFTLGQSDEANPYSEAGRARHAVDEAAIKAGNIPSVLVETWPGYEWRAEVPFAYDLGTDTGRELVSNGHRDYSTCGPLEIPGTVDALGVKRDETGKVIAVAIADKKGFEEVTRAKDNPQLRFLALAVCRTYGLDAAEVGITSEGRAPDVAPISAFDLEETAIIVREIVLAIRKTQEHAAQGLPVSFVTGRHCRWCGGFASCPKQRELMALVSEPRFQVENQIALQDDQDAADAYEIWKRIGILHKRIGEQIYGRARHAPIPLPNGKVFGERTKAGNKSIDGDVTYAVLRELYGQEIADAAVSREASQASIERALKTTAAHGSLSEAKRRVLAVIDERGGISQKPKTVIEEFEARYLEKTG